ncbi:MAG TPA: AAA family ATPase, partial [Vicinamibacterales bacterium]|nr:AAA family ATPase [Vicinamibacterales bacterium]
MARLTGSLHTPDETFRTDIGTLLRTTAVQVSLADERSARAGAPPDIIFVDGRADLDSSLQTIERLRATHPVAVIFFMAAEANPDLILHAMRAGANEFFAWPPSRSALDEALQRTAARRAAAPSTGPESTTLVFFGAKGGAGTTTIAVNCGVDIARMRKRPTLIVDLKPGLGEVTLFLGVRSRYTLLDALDNLHRLDSEFMRELVVKHKSGLEILAGSDLFDRPSSADSGALEELFRILGRQYEYILVDAGSQMSPPAVAGLYTADQVYLIASPDVPSVRNAQRLLDRIGQLGTAGERVRLLLNRAAEPYPIPPAQIEKAVGLPIFQTFLSDY